MKNYPLNCLREILGYTRGVILFFILGFVLGAVTTYLFSAIKEMEQWQRECDSYKKSTDSCFFNPDVRLPSYTYPGRDGNDDDYYLQLFMEEKAR